MIPLTILASLKMKKALNWGMQFKVWSWKDKDTDLLYSLQKECSPANRLFKVRPAADMWTRGLQENVWNLSLCLSELLKKKLLKLYNTWLERKIKVLRLDT